ncbi:MAG: cob(I)yrinic acid a,c-diamide adenosyltransferase [Bacteroidales bacterium]|jgi:cob(I)alamin adenosyltransferase|nr:cob(I)yrinic acid a,c-diamide adenosyltransferase [Bacteroidales bacterium]
MKIYTKNGDKGNTTLLGGTKTSKSDIKVDVYGNIDELNSFIGLALNYVENERNKEFLLNIQKNLFRVGNVFSADWAVFDASTCAINEKDVTVLEKEIDFLSKTIVMPNEFILPGGNLAASSLHVCRSIARRAERFAVAYHEIYNTFSIKPQSVDPLSPLRDITDKKNIDKRSKDEAKSLTIALKYLNRLSDYLFVVALSESKSSITAK